MNIFQKILFPFSGPKTKSLENKWWHRLAKVAMIILLSIAVLFVYGDASDNIKQIENPKRQFNSKDVQKFRDLLNEGIDKEVVREMIYKSKGLVTTSELGRKIKEIYPEYADKKNEELGQKMIEKYSTYFAKVDTSNEVLGYVKYALSIIRLILSRAILIYLISIGVQLVYFKGIIYIVYGNKLK